MASATKDVNAAKDNKKPVMLPAPNSNFYRVTECLNALCHRFSYSVASGSSGIACCGTARHSSSLTPFGTACG